MKGVTKLTIDISKRKNAKKIPKKYDIPSKIAATILAIILAILFMSLVIKLVGSTHGYDNHEDATTAFLTSISEKDKSTARKCFYSFDSNYNKNIDDITSFIKKSTIEIYPDSEKNITETIDADIDQLISENNSISNISDAKNTISYIYATDGDIEKYIIYQITTIKIKNKWYVYAVDNSLYEIIDMPSSTIDTRSEFGTETLGYLNMLEDWSLSQSENDYVINTIDTMYLSNKDNTLTVSAINLLIPLDEFSLQITDNLLSEGNILINNSDSTIAGIPCKKITSYDSENNMYHYIWIYKQILQDEYIHYIELSGNNIDSAYPIIKTYHTRKENTY